MRKRSVPKEIPLEVEVSIVKMIVITRDDCISLGGFCLLMPIFVGGQMSEGAYVLHSKKKKRPIVLYCSPET